MIHVRTVCILTILAVSASAALAAPVTKAASPEWSIEGKALSGAEATESKQVSAFALAVPARGLTVECKRLSSMQGRIEAPKFDFSYLQFNECGVVGALTCLVPPITTSALTTELSTFGTSIYDAFRPIGGGSIMTVTISGCAAAGRFPVAGETCGKSQNALGVQSVEQVQSFSKSVSELCLNTLRIRTGLTFAGSPATLTGEASTYLSGTNRGKRFGAI